MTLLCEFHFYMVSPELHARLKAAAKNEHHGEVRLNILRELVSGLAACPQFTKRTDHEALRKAHLQGLHDAVDTLKALIAKSTPEGSVAADDFF